MNKTIKFICKILISLSLMFIPMLSTSVLTTCQLTNFEKGLIWFINGAYFFLCYLLVDNMYSDK